MPVVIQDAHTRVVLMLGFMNEEALEQTIQSNRVTFYSRTRKTLWTKGETSGNYLDVVDIKADCDSDTLLVKAKPTGPVCHTGQETCFNEKNENPASFFPKLEDVIQNRKKHPVECHMSWSDPNRFN